MSESSNHQDNQPNKRPKSQGLFSSRKIHEETLNQIENISEELFGFIEFSEVKNNDLKTEFGEMKSIFCDKFNKLEALIEETQNVVRHEISNQQNTLLEELKGICEFQSKQSDFLIELEKLIKSQITTGEDELKEIRQLTSDIDNCKKDVISKILENKTENLNVIKRLELQLAAIQEQNGVLLIKLNEYSEAFRKNQEFQEKNSSDSDKKDILAYNILKPKFNEFREFQLPINFDSGIGAFAATCCKKHTISAIYEKLVGIARSNIDSQSISNLNLLLDYCTNIYNRVNATNLTRQKVQVDDEYRMSLHRKNANDPECGVVIKVLLQGIVKSDTDIFEKCYAVVDVRK